MFTLWVVVTLSVVLTLVHDRRHRKEVGEASAEQLAQSRTTNARMPSRTTAMAAARAAATR